jgi:hypothetical protein
MRVTSRPLAVALTAVAITAAASPAIAATKAKPTSLNARASHSTVAPKHKTTVFVTLRSGNQPVAGEAANLTVRNRTSSSARWTVTKPAATEPTAGHYTVVVTVSGALKKGQKEQFVVAFTGDKTYAASHSQVFTITAG